MEDNNGIVYQTKGKKYVVTEDVEEGGWFKEGDILIAVENDNIPWCVLEEDYDPSIDDPDDYPNGVKMELMYLLNTPVHKAEIEEIKE